MDNQAQEVPDVTPFQQSLGVVRRNDPIYLRGQQRTLNMSRATAAGCLVVLASTAALTPVSSGISAPIAPLALAAPQPAVEQVRLRRNFHGGFHGPRFYRMGPYRGYRGHGWGGYGPGWGVAPFIAGAIVGGVLAAPYYAPYYGPNRAYGPYRHYGYYGYPYVGCNNWRQDCGW